MSEPFTLQFTVSTSDIGCILREFLLQNNISRTALTDIKYHGGCILVNGKEETVRYSLQEGDIITIKFPPEQTNSKIKQEALPFSIIYEDDVLLVAEKPAGMSTIPSREHPNGTLANAVAYHYRQTGQNSAIHFVTRLDYDTSGLVLIAKHRHIHHLLSLAQQQNAITKEYLALIAGTLSPPHGCIDQPIGRAGDSIILREVRADGQTAKTLYDTNCTFQIDEQTYSMLRLRLITGRTHQIRVHLQFLGHPLLGDALYGGDCTYISRQALHCTHLQFNHPITNMPLQFDCPLPEDLQQIVKHSKEKQHC